MRKNLRTGFIAIPIMVIELFTGLWLWYLDMSITHHLNILFLLIIGLSTFIFQGPLHLLMGIGSTEKDITKLIKTNWIRTVSWTVRSGLLMCIMLSK